MEAGTERGIGHLDGVGLKATTRRLCPGPGPQPGRQAQMPGRVLETVLTGRDSLLIWMVGEVKSEREESGARQVSGLGHRVDGMPFTKRRGDRRRNTRCRRSTGAWIRV